ncbi:hypothetical protein SUDANB21_06804 (plasmid) [Streptomyces sp. enrichment culture]
MSERKPYKTNLSDEQWALIEPVIAAWKAARPSVSGHQGRYEMREIVNALLYQGRTGCQWDLLPHDLSPRGALMCYFKEKARRKADPNLVVLDTQSAAAGVPAESTCADGRWGHDWTSCEGARERAGDEDWLDPVIGRCPNLDALG